MRKASCIQKANELPEQLKAGGVAALRQQDSDVDALGLELQTSAEALNQLGAKLAGIVGSEKGTLPQGSVQLGLDLGSNDEPPVRWQKGTKKVKGQRTKNPPKTRLPYRRFYAQDNTEIRVGKQAEDNDELSLRPEHRDGSNWWMHATGHPGAHVVIRCSDESLDEEVVQDAAALAARQSKCTRKTIKVSMTRCRDVEKPVGARAGLVLLTGQVWTIRVKVKDARKRLQRLDSTVVMNYSN
ncbi:Domain of unknown function (DUF814) [Seminavis robusta]|uniref:NFACT RNA-binding domain-containing protein n=1 Tax=Seminavis robusta TaxID=568900 RepID=A0A9N8E689_9STRA|nr:Domain of unknown function (DUF814) [Seminavis robusta]|eukprot:Sro587_g171290.1 Domain of unknown function (DUF814) (241) ;mRNA; r:13520-14357